MGKPNTLHPRMKSRTNSACIMPDSGLIAPARMLVAVRAIVPVTLIPPNKADTILASPCATSSMLERCLRPDMLSATFADSRLSTPPSSVNDRADGSSWRTSAHDSCGACGVGSPRGISPKRLPIVSAGSCSQAAAIEARTTAISIPGQFGRNRRTTKISAAHPRPSTAAAGVTVEAALPSPTSLGMRGPGSAPSR